jgi:hypothetical protein
VILWKLGLKTEGCPITHALGALQRLNSKGALALDRLFGLQTPLSLNQTLAAMPNIGKEGSLPTFAVTAHEINPNWEASGGSADFTDTRCAFANDRYEQAGNITFRSVMTKKRSLRRKKRLRL